MGEGERGERETVNNGERSEGKRGGREGGGGERDREINQSLHTQFLSACMVYIIYLSKQCIIL